MSSNSLAPQYIKYEIRRGVEPSHMEKYTFIDRYFHSQRELLDIRHSEERDINTLFTYLNNLHSTADKLLELLLSV